MTYQDLTGAGADTINRWVAESVEFYSADPEILGVEWKTRGHDHAPGLHAALLDNGFVPDEPESIMIGAASALEAEVELPPGVNVRQVTEEPDIRAMSAMQDEVFGSHTSDGYAEGILRRMVGGTAARARARAATAMGKTLIHSDSTEYSRPTSGTVRPEPGFDDDAVSLAPLNAPDP